MEKTQKKEMLFSGIRRIIALLLVFSLVVIPVQFPNSANAKGYVGEDITSPNYFADDFSSDQYLLGVKYKWNPKAYSTSITEDGVYATRVGDGTTNFLNLKTVDASGKDPSANWTNYTFEADVRRDGALTSADMICLVGRRSAAGYYYVTFNGDSFALWTCDASGYTERLRDTWSFLGGRDYDGWVHMKVTFRGNKISIILNGNKNDGTPVETVHDFVDNTFTKGGVALMSKRSTSLNDPWLAYFKNAKLTLENGTVVYNGDVDLRNSVTSNGITCTWEEEFTNQSSYSIRGGQFQMNSGPGEGLTDENGGYGWYYNWNILSADARIDGKTVNLAESWDNYSVEATITRHTGGNGQAGIVGRATYSKSVYPTCYIFSVKDDRLVLAKCYFDPVTGAFKTNQMLMATGNTGGGSATDTLMSYLGRGASIRLKMEFLDNTIRCYYNDRLYMEYVDEGQYGAPNKTGSVGMFLEGRGWYAEYDDFLVTPTGDTTSFFDDFSDDRHMHGVTYQLKTTEEPEKLDVTYNWTTQHPLKFEDGAFVAENVPQNITMSFLNGTTQSGIDVDQTWYNYTVEADLKRVGSETFHDRIYLAGKVNDEGYYTLEFNGDVTFNWVDATGKITPVKIDRKFLPTGYDGWIHAKMIFQDDVITVSVTATLEDNTVKELTYKVPDFNGPKFSNGGIGIGLTGVRPWVGYYKNIKVTLEDGTVVYTDPFNEHVNTEKAQAVTYTWIDKSEGNTKIEATDGVLKHTTTRTFNDTIAYLQGITADGTVVTDTWTDYKVEADVRRENDAEGNGIWLLGRVNGDNHYYGLGFSGDTLNFARFGGEFDKDYCRIGIKAVSLPRATEDWVHIWMSFEGQRIRYGISYKDKNGIDKNNEYVYYAFLYENTCGISAHAQTPALGCDKVYTNGSIAIRLSGTSEDYGPDRKPGTGDEDGPVLGYFDNIKVTLADGTVAYDDGFNNVPVSAREDATYTWTQIVPDGNIAEADNGVYKSTVKANTKNYAVLKGISESNTDALSSWKNYTFEADVTRKGASSAGDRIYLLGRVNGQGSYGVMYSGSTIGLCKVDANRNVTVIAEKPSNIGDGTFNGKVHLKAVFFANQITVSLSGMDAAGTPVFTEYTFTDNTYSTGGVGLLVEGTAQWTAEVDNIRVTLGNGIVVYNDPVNSPLSQYTNYTWIKNHVINNLVSEGVVEEDGNKYYSMVTNPDRVFHGLILSGVKGTENVTQAWTDYTVDVKLRRTAGNYAAGGIIGRVQPVDPDDPSKGYTGYVVRARHDQIRIDKLYVNGQGKISAYTDLATLGIGSAPTGVWCHMRVEFSGKTITVYMYSIDAEGNLSLINPTLTRSWTDNEAKGAAYLSGGVGLYTGYSQMSLNLQMDYDDVKVTLDDGTENGDVVFFEDFSGASDYFTGAEYVPPVPSEGYDCAFDADGLVIENGYVPPVSGYENAFDMGGMTLQNAYVPAQDKTAANNAFYSEGRVIEGAYTVPLISNWNISNGSLYKTGTDDYPQILTVNDGVADYTGSWQDYSVEMDIMLTGDYSCGSVVFNYNNLGYYEFRVDGSKAYLLYSSSETPLVTKDLKMAQNSWYFVKVENVGKVINCYVNGALLITYTMPTLMTGTVGLRAVSNVRYDNMAVYHNEQGSYRKFRNYKFDAKTPDELTSVWIFDDTSKWSISDRSLYYAGSAMGKIQLRTKELISNYFAEISFTPTTETASVGVIGRAIDNNGYTIKLDMAKGLTLYRNGTTMGSVSMDDLYLKGVKLLLNKEYTLRLEMFDGSIRCFVDGVRVLQVKDKNPLPAGVVGITASKGVGIRSLVTGESFMDAALSFVDFDGKVHKTFTVTPGKVPDIKNMYLKVDNGTGEPKLVLLDQVMDDSKFDENATGTVTIPVEYDGSVINFTYQVVERPEYIKKLNKDIEALDLETVTEAQYKDLYNRFNDLSFKEKPSITEANQQKLKEARHIVLVALHPFLADYEVAYEESFDTRDVADQFNYSRFENGTRTTGNWYVENGVMQQYYEDDTHVNTLTWSAARLEGRSFEVRYMSVDFMIHEANTWAGMCLWANDEDNTFYQYFVSDKSKNLGYWGNRVYLAKMNVAQLSNAYLQHHLDEDEMYYFEPDTWYNLEMIITEDHYFRLYVNGRLISEVQDKANPIYDNVFDTGSIGITSLEGCHAFDNIIVYGKEVEHVAFDRYNHDLEAGNYTDDFQDEKANVGKNPSHWIEDPQNDKWLLKSSGSNVFYGVKNNTTTHSETWLHVFETDVDYSVQMRVTDKGQYPTLGLTARVSMRDSFIHAGYDTFLQKWFVQYQRGANWEVKTVYADKKDTAVDFSNWVTVRIRIEEDILYLYKGNTLMLSTSVEERPGVGRVGIFAENCNVDIDNVKLELLSGQGRVQDGVLEYYLSDQGFNGAYDVLVGPNGELFLSELQGVSTDGGATFRPRENGEFPGFRIENTVRLHNGNYVTVHVGNRQNGDGTSTATLTPWRGVRGADGTVTWTQGEKLPTNPTGWMAQPNGHINEVRLADGSYRVFIAYAISNGEDPSLLSDKTSTCDCFYSDDEGLTWKRSETDTRDVIGQPLFTESHVISVPKDTTDVLGNKIPKGTLVHYTSYCSRNNLSYTLSFDGGVTWEGDYSVPYIITTRGSFAVEEDLYNPGTYYMNVFYGYPNRVRSGDMRYHVVLARSYDAINWHFLCDVDRFSPDAGADEIGLFHLTNAYIEVAEDYVFPSFGRNEKWTNNGHNIIRPVLHRFEKSKLVDQEWPKEYRVDEKEIVYIEALPVRTVFPKFGNFTLEGGKILVHYYDGTTEQLDMAELYDKGSLKLVVDEMETEGTQRVRVVYKFFGAVYEITVTSGHEGGTATCVDRAICDLCGQPYGRTTDHTIEFVKGYDATETTEGLMDHYACTFCHDTFSDVEGKRKIDAVIPAWVQVEDGEATVDDVMVDKIIENAADEIVLDLNYADKFVQDVIFTGEGFKKAAEEGKPFKIVTSEVTVTFDATAVQAIADAVNKRNDVTISVKVVDASQLNESQTAAIANANVTKILSAQVTSKGKEISDFGGGAVTVRIPGAKDQQLWYLADDGTVENLYVTFEGDDMVVELYHFSLYALVAANDNTGLIILIVALVVLAALCAVVFLVPPVRKKVFGLFQKKKEELPEPEATEETEIINE